MGYDDVIPLLGGFGRYQKRIYFLLCLPIIVCAFHKFGNVFLQAKPEHRCQLIYELPNASYVLPPEILEISFPFDEKSNAYSSCSMFSDNEVVPCDGYIYDDRKYKSSTVIEWNLVCDDGYLRTLGDMLFMVGIMLGAIIFGDLSDRCGRKIIFFVSLVIQVVFGTLAAFAPEYWTFTISRLVVGATTSGVYLVAYVIAMEMVGLSDRLVAGVVCHMFFASGYMLIAALAYFITNWRNLQLALTLPGVVFFCYWWFIPESVCWLLTKNRFPQAMKLVQIIAKENQVTISEEQLEQLLIGDVQLKNPKAKRVTILDILRYPILTRRTLIIFFDWFVITMTYYGLSWNTSNLGSNDYLNFVISGAVEIPAYTFLLLTLNRFGRKKIVCGCMVTAGVALLLTMAVPENLEWLVITFTMLGKLAITGSFGTIYVFTTEQFPTVIRNAGLGAGSTSGRFGAIFAPLINLTSEIWKPMPMIIFGILALIGGVLSLFLPETLNRELPETFADWEQFGISNKITSSKSVTTEDANCTKTEQPKNS